MLRRDGHVLRKVLEFDMEDALGEGEQKCWLGEKGRHEASVMENGS